MKHFFLTEPLETEWLTARLKHAQGMILYIKMNHFCLTGEQADQIPPLLHHYQPLREQEGFEHLDQAFLWYDLLAGDIIKTRRTLDQRGYTLAYEDRIEAILAFLDNKPEEALVLFDRALKEMKKDTRQKKLFLGVQESLFYSLAVLQTQNKKHYAHLQDVFSHLGQYDRGAFPFLEKVLLRLQGFESLIRKNLSLDGQKLDPLSSAVATLAEYWMDKISFNLNRCRTEFERYQTVLPLVARIFAEILAQENPQQEDYQNYLSQEKWQGMVSFVNLVRMGEQWEITLNHLNQFFEQQKQPEVNTAKRLMWLFHPKTHSLEALEQSRMTRGGWTKGRSVALRRLRENDLKLDYLTDHDQRCINTLHYEGRGWGGQAFFEWDPPNASGIDW